MDNKKEKLKLKKYIIKKVDFEKNLDGLNLKELKKLKEEVNNIIKTENRIMKLEKDFKLLELKINQEI